MRSGLTDVTLAQMGEILMYDATSSRRVSAWNSPHPLSARDRLPPAYGLAVMIGLSAALWAIIIGTVLFLL